MCSAIALTVATTPSIFIDRVPAYPPLALGFSLSTANSTANSILTINDGNSSGGSMNLLVSLGYLPTVGTLFKIIDLEEDAVAGGLVTGKFTQVDSVVSTFGGYDVTFGILYNSTLGGGDGNDVVLQVTDVSPVPEPAAFAVVGMALSLLSARRRRTR